jgi:hypothetical protein
MTQSTASHQQYSRLETGKVFCPGEWLAPIIAWFVVIGIGLAIVSALLSDQ